MSLKIDKKTIYLSQQAPKNELDRLNKRLNSLVAEAMVTIAKIAEECKANNHLGYGFWYAQDIAEALIKTKNQNRYSFLKEKVFLISGRMPTTYFQSLMKLEIPDEKRDFQWILKENIKPSDALISAMNGFKDVKSEKNESIGFSIIDCGMAVSIARHIALFNYFKEVNGVDLGTKKFDRLFSAPNGLAMNLGYVDDDLQLMRYLVDFTNHAKKGIPGTTGQRPIEVGHVVSMNGVPEYEKKHPMGQGSNYNVVCISAEKSEAQRFTGLGLSEKGETESEINEMMLQEYNKTPDHQIRVPTTRLGQLKLILDLNQSKTYESDQKDLKNVAQVVKGYDAYSPQQFVAEVIYDLVKAPLENISLDFVKNHPLANKNYPSSDLQVKLQQLFSALKK